MTEIKSPIWDIDKTEKNLLKAFADDSEIDLLKILKDNSFLFYNLYSRKGGIQPVFREISFGAKLRCDFAWLNDNSDGPEWVLLEVEKPKMRIFNSDKKPSSQLNNAIEQVKTWDRYFLNNAHEKKRIFGAVAKFRFVLVAGDGQSWSGETASKWRNHNNTTSNIEIRTTEVFLKAIKFIKEKPDEFWSFEEHPTTLQFSKLEDYWKGYGYMDNMRKIF
jgi:hypothetical protein